MNDPAAQSPAIPSIVWIASYPKSGNTWTRVFLSNLLNEIHNNDENGYDINTLIKWSKRDAALRHFTRRLDKPIEKATAAEIAAMRRDIQADLARETTEHVYVKTHNAVATVEGSPTINFDVTRGAIYLVRNPLDVAISYTHHLSGNTDDVITYMANPDATTSHHNDKLVYEFMSSWSLNVASWFSVAHRPVLVVRYEDMLAMPERTFGRIVSFLGLKATREQIDRAIEHSSFDRLQQQEVEHGFAERPANATQFFRSGKAGQWKTELSPQQVKRIVEAHSSMMMRCGYLSEQC